MEQQGEGTVSEAVASFCGLLSIVRLHSWWFTLSMMVSQKKGGDFFAATFRAAGTYCDFVAFTVYYHYMVGLARNPYRTPNEIWKSTANKGVTHSSYDCNWYICQQLFPRLFRVFEELNVFSEVSV